MNTDKADLLKKVQKAGKQDCSTRTDNANSIERREIAEAINEVKMEKDFPSPKRRI